MNVGKLTMQQAILADIADTSKTRDDIAEAYALLIDEPDIQWGRVNRAIIARWSEESLQRIKTKAWSIRGD